MNAREPAREPNPDLELQGLLEMCHEAESLEHGAGAQRPGAASPVFTFAWRRLALAAALLLAAGTSLYFATRPSTPISPLVADSTTLTVAGPSTPATPEPFVLLTIFQELDGGCQCVTRREFEPEPGRTMLDLSRSELIDLALADSCMTTAERVVVIGVSGPMPDLPRSQHEAEALALCLDTCVPDGSTSSIEPAAIDCLPASVSVVTEVLALGLR